MKHSNNKRTLGRSRSQRTALMRGLAVSLIRDGQITTTLAKAKELQPQIERLVTHAKTDSVQTRRHVASKLGEPTSTTITKLFRDVAPKFAERSGGYTRIVKLGQTSGREEAVIAFVE